MPLSSGGPDSGADLGEIRKAEKEAGARAIEARAKVEAARQAEAEQLKLKAVRRKARVDSAAMQRAPVKQYYHRTKDLRPDTTEEEAEKEAIALAKAEPFRKMGESCDKLGRYSEALVHYQKATDIYRAELGPQHPALGSTWNRMGEVCEKQEKLVEAMRHYQMAADTGALSPPAPPTSSD